MLPLLLALCLALTACTDAAQPAASGTSAAQASPSASASASAQEATPAPAAEDVATLVQGASESMILVNADNPVGEGFQPPVLKSLKSLITQPVKLDDDSIQADPCVADAMNAMLSAAKADGEATMRIQNGYRSYKRQKEIFDSTVNYHKTQEKKTEQEAMTITKSKVAVPGYSEHHTGPVSYTHLDVYKRQPSASTVPLTLRTLAFSVTPSGRATVTSCGVKEKFSTMM